MKTRRAMEKILMSVLVSILLLGIVPMKVKAANEIPIQKLVTAQAETEAKEAPSDDAKTMMTYAAGVQIAVVEEADENWYKVVYQGNIYYVKQENTVQFDKGYEQEELDRQFEEEKIESKILIEEVVRQRKEAKQTRIWGAIIVVLVLAIFGVGIYSHLAAKKDGKKEEK